MAGPPGVQFAHKWTSGAAAGFGHIGGGTAGVAVTGKGETAETDVAYVTDGETLRQVGHRMRELGVGASGCARDSILQGTSPGTWASALLRAGTRTP